MYFKVKQILLIEMLSNVSRRICINTNKKKMSIQIMKNL